jgi:hypothetical protein
MNDLTIFIILFFIGMAWGYYSTGEHMNKQTRIYFDLSEFVAVVIFAAVLIHFIFN